MKDKNYSLIDKVIKQRKFIKEYKWALRVIHSNLKKGIGDFDLRLQYDEVAEMISQLGFDGIVRGTYHSMIAGQPSMKKYNFTALTDHETEKN